MSKEFHIKAKNYSNIFIELGEDFDSGKPEIYMGVHIVGASCSVRMTIEKATELMQALQELLKDEQVV
jgi:hypothetical protein